MKTNMESDIVKVENIFQVKFKLSCLPYVFLGVKLFFFLSLSSKDANSSSELDESSIAVGVKTLLGVFSDVGVLRAGTVKGEEGGFACELPT